MKRQTIIIIIFLMTSSIVKSQTYNYDFETTMQSWTCDFADYNIGDSLTYGLFWTHDTLPVIPVNHGLILNGNNFSDDLFFFCKNHVTGLLPNTTYRIIFSVDLVTKDSYSSIGGSDLMFKAGATIVEPVKFPEIGSAMMRMNIDKGNQMGAGVDMDTLGLVRHSFPDTAYHLLTLDNALHPFNFTTDVNGNAWLTIGAESMFEVFAEFLVAEIRVEFINTTGIDELPISKNNFLYPNPGSGILKIDPVISLPAEVRVFDCLGRVVFEVVVEEGWVDVGGLREGIYWFLIISGSKKYFDTVVIRD